MKDSLRLIFFLSLRSVFCLSDNSFKKCATFIFPNISSREFVGEERAQANLIFVLKSNTCSKGLDSTYIQVFKDRHRVCAYSTCNALNIASDCRCLAVPGWSVLTKTLDRTDNAEWRWSASDEELNVIGDASLSFRITYPSKITSLIVNKHEGPGPHFVFMNQSFEIVCSWENGSPPSIVRLLDWNGRVLGTKDESGNLTHVIVAAVCNNSGLIRCEAGGSSVNMSATLLVKCPPTFLNNIVKKITILHGEKVELVLSVISYTMEMTECHLKKFSGANVYVVYVCGISMEEPGLHTNSNSILPEEACHCRMGGLVPTVTLRLFMFNVTEKHTGLWSLTISNTVGKAEVNIMFDVNKVNVHVTNLTVNGHLSTQPYHVSRNATVQIVCSWKNGNPTTAVNLIDAQGHLLQSSLQSNGNMTYMYLTVRCQDAGIIRCEASNSTKNMSATLLVECSPIFGNANPEARTVVAGQVITLIFPVRTHTSCVHDCHVLRTDSSGDPVSGISFTKYPCALDLNHTTVTDEPNNLAAGATYLHHGQKCACRLNGTAPDLTLSVTLLVTKIDTAGARWRVSASNNIGNGQTEFILHVIDNDFRWEQWMTVTAVTVSFSLVAAIGLVVCIVRRVRQMSTSSSNFNAPPNQLENTSQRHSRVNVSCSSSIQNIGTSVHRNPARIGAFQCDSHLESLKEVPARCGLKFLRDKGDAMKVEFYTDEHPATSGSPQSSSGKQDYLLPCTASEYSTLDPVPGEDNFQESCDNGQEIDFRLDNSQDPHSPHYCTLLPSPVDNKSFACLDSEATSGKDNKPLVPPKERNTQTCKSQAPVRGDESDYSTID